MEIGDIIQNKSEVHVVTQITNGVVTDTERLVDYISKSVVVNFEGEMLTLHEIIQFKSGEYVYERQKGRN